MSQSVQQDFCLSFDDNEPSISWSIFSDTDTKEEEEEDDDEEDDDEVEEQDVEEDEDEQKLASSMARRFCGKWTRECLFIMNFLSV